jgi:hypothetical protein
MGLGTACKEETSRMKNVLIENSGEGGGKRERREEEVFDLNKTVCAHNSIYAAKIRTNRTAL